MTTQFDRPLVGFRFADINVGDSLQTIAARELGDAARWVELIAYNNLVPPFIVNDPLLVVAGVKTPGDTLLVPAPSPVVETTTDPEKVFQTDMALARGGRLTFNNGDFSVVAGRENLKQALKNRIETEQGDLIYHTQYGSRVKRLIGVVNGPTASLLAAQYSRSAVLQDPRISTVKKASAEVVGEAINVTVEAEPISSRPLKIEATI
jgi:phage baseplate assembly protein W